MKKYYFFIIAAFVAAIVSSCQKNAEVTQDSVSDSVVRTFTCTLADPTPDTKIGFTIDEVNHLVKTEWEVGDEILFHGKYCGSSYSAVVTLTAGDISADKKSFTVPAPTFTNGADEGKWATYSSVSNICVAYPASAVITSEGSSQNWYNKTKFNESNLPLVAGFNDGYDSGNFIMYNLCGIISFSVSGTGDNAFDSFVLEGRSGETVGYTGYITELYKNTSSTETLNWVKSGTPLTQIAGTVIPDGSTVQRVCIPNGVNFTSGLNIKFLKSGVIKKEVKTGAVNIPRNGYLALGDVTSHLKDYVAPSHVPAEWTDGTGIAGVLDRSEAPANCYIIYATDANKAVKIKAVKGSGTSPIGTIGSVSVIWETYNDATAVTSGSIVEAVDYSTDSEYVFFKIPSTFHAGNALIAAKSAGGEILWSWHIWAPSTVVTNSADGYGGKTQNGMMDRNLGALTVTEAADANADIVSAGLMYQWGRKDPFMGPKAYGTNEPAVVSGTAKSNVTEQMTVAQSIKNPTVFVAFNGDWTSETDNNIWADDNAASKSIYDPCPAGYRVPQRTTSFTFWNSTSLSDQADWTLDATHYWFKVFTPAAVFPIAGYIYKSGGYDQSGVEAYIWSSHIGSDTIAYAKRLKSDGTTKNEQPVKASGANVRCVAVASE